MSVSVKKPPIKATTAKGDSNKYEGKNDLCPECGRKVNDTDGGVQCEICSYWFHCKCQEISPDTYKALSNDDQIHWYCEGCNRGIVNLHHIVTDIQSRVQKVEGDVQAVKKEVDDIRQNILQTSHKVERKIDEFSEQFEATVSNLKKEIEKNSEDSMLDNAKVEKLIESKVAAAIELHVAKQGTNAEQESSGTVPKILWSDKVANTDIQNRFSEIAAEVNLLQKQTSDLQQDKIEQEDRNKRKNCVIIQGLVEAEANNSDDRKKVEKDNVEDILHSIKCDNVSVTSCFRLGKLATSAGSKPRPLKLVLASEAQKEQVLQSAKNLKGMSNGLAQVYIHQDLTPKQRETRRILVHQLKERQARGEANLIIIDNNIVQRRSRT